MNNYWQFHDSKMLELKSIYKRKDKQLQNKLQDIFNRFNIEFSEIYNIADSKIKEMTDIYIEELEDNNLLTGMFGIMAKNIKNRKRVKYSEILLLMIYGIYQEEQKKLDEIELKIIKEEANYYYQQGQKEVNKNRRVSNITDTLLFSLLAIPDSKGYVWEDYKEGIKKYNAEQIYRQVIINLQQGNKLDISQVDYQNILKKQQNSKLSINTKEDDIKISGSIDNLLIGIDNQAKIEGIKEFDENAIVKIVAVHDEKTTEMCKSLDNQFFYVHDWNEFERYSDANKKIMKYKCFGLIVGLNCPPINDNFHYCRSTIIYSEKILDEDEGDLLENVKYKMKQFLYDNKVAKYKDLSKNYKILFENQLQNAESQTKRILQNIYNKTDYLIVDVGNSKYNRKLDIIKLNIKNNDVSTLAHELFHKIDTKNKITKNNDLRKYLEKDLKRIGLNRESYINEILKYDRNAFKIDKHGKFVLNEKYRGLADIINGTTNGEIKLGYGHPKEYWNKDKKNLSRETFAQFGRMYYDNDNIVIHTLENILPSTKQIIDINLRRIK